MSEKERQTNPAQSHAAKLAERHRLAEEQCCNDYEQDRSRCAAHHAHSGGMQ
jgi:hypothetical protein